MFFDIKNAKTIKDVFDNCSIDEQYEYLNELKPFFGLLYKAGCHHIDINTGAIILADKTYLIDMQHTIFLNKPSLKSMIFQIAYFLKSLKYDSNCPFIKKWLLDIIKSSGILEKEKNKQVVDWFQYYSNTELSRLERKRIVDSCDCKL